MTHPDGCVQSYALVRRKWGCRGARRCGSTGVRVGSLGVNHGYGTELERNTTSAGTSGGPVVRKLKGKHSNSYSIYKRRTFGPSGYMLQLYRSKVSTNQPTEVVAPLPA
jgi:hypothetical protein